MKNIHSKCALLIALFLMINNFVLSQDKEVDVIYLKNGKTITGKIVEQIPDKVAIIDTESGIEIIDFSDIKNIDKDRIPTVRSFTPANGTAGSSVRISGDNFGIHSSKGRVLFGSTRAAISSWTNNEIVAVVPELEFGSYTITIQIGTQKDNSVSQFRVTAPVQQQEYSVQQSQRTQSDSPYDNTVGGFWLYFAYVKPTGDFAATMGQFIAPSGPYSGFAKEGFSTGFEGRAALSNYVYLPISYHLTYQEFDIDQLGKQTFTEVSSESKAYLSTWFTLGLGFAIPFSSGVYLFGSGDYGGTLIRRPDVQYGSTNHVKYNSAETFTTGFGYSFGISFTDAVTFGYKFLSAKPKHKVTYYNSNDFKDRELEVEQPTSMGLIYISFGV